MSVVVDEESRRGAFVFPRRPVLLVVDDQPNNIELLQQVFSDDYDVLSATGGAEALELCRHTAPDLVLLDVVMPEMDGFEVCALLKSRAATRHIPVIFVTANNDVKGETRGLDAGAVDFISKPLRLHVVRARVRTHLTLKFQSDLLREMAFIDGLTGVYNRRHFDERLKTESRRTNRQGTPMSLIMIDVDFFKRFNDCYGHQAGDDCLRQVAGTLGASMRRAGDLVARYGGEEFVCILPDMPFVAALDFASALEKRIAALGILHEMSDVGQVVTVSLGVGVREPGGSTDPAALLALADEQLYAAKQSGRRRACGARLPMISQPAPPSAGRTE